MIDIHTHKHAAERKPEDGAEMCVISVEPTGFTPSEGEVYSVGFHPWNIAPAGPSPEEWELFETLAGREDVVAVGECGLDSLKGPVMAIQMNVFRRQAEIAEHYGKPVIIHCVKAFDQLIGLKKAMNPSVPWVIHGFRGKASVAKMLLKAEFYLSVGERFNPEAVKEIPPNRLLIETDESELSIREIGKAVSAASGIEPEKLAQRIRQNCQGLFSRCGGTGS